jgi:hypothetical protein
MPKRREYSPISGMPMSWASRTVMVLRDNSMPVRKVDGP